MIYANEVYARSLSQYFPSLLEEGLTVFHLEMKNQEGKLQYELILQRAFQSVQEGLAVILVGIAPEHDYSKYPAWNVLVAHPRVRFIRLPHEAETVESTTKTLLYGEPKLPSSN